MLGNLGFFIVISVILLILGIAMWISGKRID